MFNPYMPPMPAMNQYGQPFQPGQQMPQMPTVQSPQTMQAGAQVQQEPPAFLQVASAKDFGSVTVQPGKRAFIMAQNEPFLAFKAADLMGMVQTTIYHIEPVSEDQINNPAGGEYVTRKEFNEFVQQLTAAQNNKGAVRSTRKEATE